eukprot:TRINITY_DN3767_c0_g1_i1.p2 TRINITY_DN3767_c0_g1~~TRINITY_DN3767_c0_g1_i1.p2  ORF type:complete len:115 (-),score=50.54 TRINITY_DN3767_c0_g1_i1:33-377(-)
MAPARTMAREFEQVLEEGKRTFDNSKREFVLLKDNYGVSKERMEDGIELMLKQKLYEIKKLEEKFDKAGNEDTGKTNALIVQVADMEKMQDKLKGEVTKLELRVKNADTYLGYS